MHRRPLACVLLASTFLQACAYGTVGEGDRKVADSLRAASEMRPQSARPLPSADVSAVSVRDGVWLGSVGVRSERGEPLPREAEVRGVTIKGSSPMTLQAIAAEITNATGIPVRLAEDATSEGSAPGAAAGVVQPAVRALPAPATQAIQASNPLFQFPSMGELQAPSESRGTMNLNWSGKLSGLLDLVCSRFNVAWEHRAGVIRIYKNAVRTFQMRALATSTTLVNAFDASSTGTGTTDSGGSGSTGGSGTGGTGSTSKTSAGQSVDAQAKIEIWKEIKDTLAAMAGDKNVAIAPASGTVTVTATPAVMERVESYITGQNERLSKQVALSVEVYSVSIDKSDQYGLDVQTLFSGFSNVALGSGAASAAASLLQTGTAGSVGDNAFGFAILKNKWAGTNGVVQALATKGDVSVVTSAALTTLNNIPAPLTVTRNQGYLRAVQAVAAANAGTTTTLTPGSIVTGFSMNFLPRILSGGQIMLQYGINLSDLAGPIQTFSSGGQTIQLPTVDTRGFVQQVMLASDSTLVLAGYEKNQSQVDKSGTLIPELPFGGMHKGQNMRNIIVIAITPKILSAPVPGKAE